MFLVCNVPIENYLTLPTRSAVSNTKNSTLEFNNKTNDPTITIESSIHTMPNNYSNPTASHNTEDIFTPTIAISSTKDNIVTPNPKTNQPPVNEHIMRHKTKQKTEIKANIDETDKHSISGFEMIETIVEEEEWVERSNVVSAQDKYQNPTTTQFNVINIEKMIQPHSNTTDTNDMIPMSPVPPKNIEFIDKTKFQRRKPIAKTAPNRTKHVRIYSKASSYSFPFTLLINLLAPFTYRYHSIVQIN